MHERGGGKGGGASGASGDAPAAVWPLTECETSAWRGAAAEACAALRVDTRGVYSGSADPGWVFPEQVRREARQAARLAMKHAGLPLERWSEAAEVGAPSLAPVGVWS